MAYYTRGEYVFVTYIRDGKPQESERKPLSTLAACHARVQWLRTTYPTSRWDMVCAK